MSDLLQKTAELVDISSVSHNEAALADVVEARLGEITHLEVTRFENNVVARTDLGRKQRLLLAGHLDTVPPSGNGTSEIRGDELFGCGSADMKGGLAVMLDLAPRLDVASNDVTLIFYACEEVAREHSGLKVIESMNAELLNGDAAILLEPTNALVEAGCQGVLRLNVTLRGRRSHSARPWVGINAIHRLVPVLDVVVNFVERMPEIDGCIFHETLQAVHVEGGVASNVVPDEVSITLSHRFAPDRTIDEAYTALVAMFDSVIDPTLGDEISLVDAAPPARPLLDHELLAKVVRASGDKPLAKIGWTDVAFFYERGIPAANFGPGDPLVAHGADEFVCASDLDRVRGALQVVLGLS